MFPSNVGVVGVRGVRDDAEADDEADDGGRGKPERADAEAGEGEGVTLPAFDALVDVVRIEAGEPFAAFSWSFFSGVAGLTLIAEVKLTLRALR